MSAITSHQHVCRPIPVPIERASRLREAILLSDYARRYSCGLQLTRGDRHVDAKDVEKTLTLLSESPGEVLLEADGPEGCRAVQGLARIVERRLCPDSRDLASMALMRPGEDAGRSPREMLGIFSLTTTADARRRAGEGRDTSRRNLEVLGLLCEESLDEW